MIIYRSAKEIKNIILTRGKLKMNATAKVYQFPIKQKTQYAQFSKSENTKSAYESDWTDFENWCTTHHQISLPSQSETICAYISDLADRDFKLSTIKRRIASITSFHLGSKFPSPITHEVNEELKGISRKKNDRQIPKKAIILEDLKLIIDSIDTSTLIGKRDKCLILLGFATCNRRSEIVSLDVEKIVTCSQGIDVYVNQEKTKNYKCKSIMYANNEYCPISSLVDWLKAANITEGAIYRSFDRHGNIKGRLSSNAVAIIIKKYAELAGLDPTLYAGHSLRSGFATSAGEKGYNHSSIMKQGGWNTPAMADRYQHDGQRFENNASSILKLL